MKDKLLELLWGLEKEKYPDYNKKADEILHLFDVSKSECKWLKVNGVYKKECTIKYKEDK